MKVRETEWAIKNEQSWETGNKTKTNKKKNTTQCEINKISKLIIKYSNFAPNIKS
jgi:hypothetical protein